VAPEENAKGSGMRLSLREVGYLTVNDERTGVVFQYDVPEMETKETRVYVQRTWMIGETCGAF
jgi:hypothetical protein